MSRLYIKHRSDRTEKGHCANERATINIFWGSASDSKKAGEIEVYWPKGADRPKVWVHVGDVVLNAITTVPEGEKGVA